MTGNGVHPVPTLPTGAPARVATPIVSVVMTVYNTEAYLPEAIESILGQTFRDFEFIIVDDGSTDDCPRILADYASRDSRITYLPREHRGIVKSANDGIDFVRAPYVARMDSDDIAEPQRLAKQVEYLDAHPEIVAVGSRVMVMDPYGSPVAPSGHKLEHAEIDAELLTGGGGWAICQPSVMMRADALRKVGGYRGRINMSEDHDLFLRMAEVGKVANLPDVLLRYRRHYQSTSHTQYRQMWQVKEEILREAFQRRGLQVPADLKQMRWQPPEQSQQLRLWGWAAIKAGNVGIARKHAVGALKATPFSLAAWKLMYCALRGR